MKRCFVGILFFAAVLVPLSQVYSASNGTVLPPAPNSTWEPGLAYQVLCISPALVYQNCNVILLRNGNTLANLGQVTMNQVGMGNFKWAVPTAQAKGGGYQIRFANQNNSIIVDSATFNIGTVQRTLKLVQPANITQAKAGDTVVLSWTYTGHTGSVSEEETKVLPTFCGYYYYGKVPLGSNGSGSFAYKIPADFKDTPNASFKVSWRPHGSTGEVSSSSPTFHLINDSQREAAGYIDVLTPQQGQVANVGSTVPITWKHANWMSGQVNIYLGYDTPIATNVPIGANGTGTYNWKVSELPRWPNPNVYITIQTVTKTHKGTSRTFTIACPQPGITVVSPAANEIWEIGTKRSIAWQTGLPASTPFDIELVDRFTNQTIRTIYTGLTAVQQGGALVYGWSIPAAYSTGNYAIRISKNGSGGCPSAVSPSFSLAGPGKINQISPFTGASVAQKEVMRIAWDTLANYNTMYVKIDLYRGSGTKVMNVASAVLVPNAMGQTVYGMTTPARTTYDWTVPTSVQPGNDYYFVFELSGLNAVTVRSGDPNASGQKIFTVKPALVEPRPTTITPVLPKAPIHQTMPLPR